MAGSSQRALKAWTDKKFKKGGLNEAATKHKEGSKEMQRRFKGGSQEIHRKPKEDSKKNQRRLTQDQRRLARDSKEA